MVVIPGLHNTHLRYVHGNYFIRITIVIVMQNIVLNSTYLESFLSVVISGTTVTVMQPKWYYLNLNLMKHCHFYNTSISYSHILWW